ncbi:LytTR family DNA-binding domain-containing protein [Sphingobacterium multivorum]|uniref:LytTR family DNA-binding domain-containing protein n=1 Tax=Sphingobacterium multivorum TaxID=28454 RepID=UPI0028AD5144|nr:LytTR family DNA-binding domain-containing protein [Sphingobacterium multivorum]
MQTKKLIEKFHSEIQVNYIPIRVQLLLAVLLGNFFCSPNKFLVFDARYAMPKFYLYWFLSSLIVMAVLRGAHIFNRYMDSRLSWLTDFKPRLIRQILYGLLLPALLTVVFVMLVFFPFTAKGWGAIIPYMRNEFRFVLLFISILNMLFLVIYVMRFARFVKDQYLEAELELAALREVVVSYETLQMKLEDERSEDLSDAIKLAPCLGVKYGYEDNYVALDGIAFIKSSANDKKLLTLTSSKEYTHNYSLETLMKVLDHNQYYLMYRRYIVNRSIIKEYRALENGILTIELKPSFEKQDDILVSRYHAADFKRWFEKA